MRTFLRVAVLAFALSACSKEKATTEPVADAEARRPPAASAADASPSAASSGAPGTSPEPARAGAAASYAGTYTAAPASLHIPEHKDYAGVKQAKDDPSKLVGEGNLSLAVDGHGILSGTIDTGPVAPALVEGVVSGGALSGTVRRKEATDDGLTGSIVGKIVGGGLEATMRLADANAASIREAKVTAKQK